MRYSWNSVVGADRGVYFDKIYSERALELKWNCAATSLLVAEDGSVTGVRYTNADGLVVDAAARCGVIVGTGGFVQNGEMVAKYYATGEAAVCPGNPLNNGVGIQMRLDAGAQMGKNFTFSCNNFGGGNEKAVPQAIVRQGPTGNPALTVQLFAGLLVNRRGSRFMDESTIVGGALDAGEALIREGRYYAICNQAFVYRCMQETLGDIMGPVSEKFKVRLMDWSDVALTEMQASLDTAIADGWAWKADGIAELAGAVGLSGLERTVAHYNAACETGYDGQFFKDPVCLNALAEGPFYAVESKVACWGIIGGIKTDEFCRALKADGTEIPGLFVVGLDADLYNPPYFANTSTAGFGVMSGYLAAETASGHFVEL